MQFIVGLLDKVAWPLVVVFGIYAMRVPLTQLIPLLKKLKYKELELEFGEELIEAVKSAEVAFPDLKHDKKSLLIATAGRLPNISIMEAWKVVDDAAELLIKSKRNDVDLDVPTRYKLIQNILVKGRFIDIKKGKLFDELRQLRNKVAHAQDYSVGKAEAEQYIELCFKLRDHFEELADPKP